ncbi:MAG: hypothetical protein A3G41_01840 [Elusimicrobia bacterium RIFCSPLOWO2_12_FULL_59_9]|nr:MAG: hypothetical protein A3G41_01840 [Elusimicrobia bacterium RIFCSPLOWO2_12_FULL_59_9]
MGKKTGFWNRMGLAAACCLAAWWAACSVMERPKDIEKISRLGASMHARFGLKLFGELVREYPGENIFISPLSAAMSLGAVYNGAGGETAAEISQAMQIPGTPVEELNRASAELLESTRQLDPQARLTEANSLWGCHIRFKPEFLNRVRRAHRAEVKMVDFANPGAAAAINAWVREKTDGRIEELVGHISPDAVLVLLNAVYFKGDWSVEFKKSMTRERSFTRLDGSTKKHPMMHQAGAYDHLETDVFQAVSLPYGDGRMSLYVFVPRRILGLGEFYKTLDEARWAGWLSRF